MNNNVTEVGCKFSEQQIYDKIKELRPDLEDIYIKFCLNQIIFIREELRLPK